jgi:hypothetical protein
MHFIKKISCSSIAISGIIAALLASNTCLAGGYQINNADIKASASSNDGHLPQYTLDNNLTAESRWSAEGNGEWILYDTGAQKIFDHINIAFYKGDVRSSKIDIQTSADKSTWKTIFTGSTPQRTLNFQSFDLKATSARYVRIVGYGNTENSWNSITEVQLFAQASTTCSTCSTQQDLEKYFDVEGNSPFVTSTLLRFDPLASKYVTPNGHGWRNELTIKEDIRTYLYKTYEHFSADIAVNLSKGSKTIISQFHGSGTGTLVKVYLSDTSESGFYNSQSTDGIFDVYVRMLGTDGKERKYPLGVIKSGASMHLDIVNNHGDVTVTALGNSARQQVKDGSGAFFKFGNYLQAQDPDTMEQVENSDDFAYFYSSHNITTSILDFTKVTYVRTN